MAASSAGSGAAGSGTGGADSEGDGDGGGYSGPNRPPYFIEGVSTERDVEEHTSRAVYIGEPVTAKDPDGDVLTYALGGADAASFALDTTAGQLITLTTLDFESKASYDLVMTVADGRGAVDAIEITIDLTDVAEVPIYNPQTQAAGWVTPGQATTVKTPDGAAAVTFPAQSRSVYYWVRLDSALTRCPFESGDEDLLAALAVDFYDNWGSGEYDVVLVNGSTVQFMLDADDFGGLEAVREGHKLGAFNVYARDSLTGSWSQVSFDFEVDDEGQITLSVPELTSLDCYVLTALTALFTPGQPVVAPTPTPTPTPEAPQGPTPTPQTEPDPTPTVESEGVKIPLLMPQAVAEAGEVENPTPEAGGSEERAEPTPAPVAMEAQVGPDTEDGGLSVWPILLMALGAALLAFSLWLFLSAKRRRKF